MKIKKYVADTSHQAMQMLKAELGPDAVVLSTRMVREKGIFKYFKKPLVEITVAYEEKDLIKNKQYAEKNNNIEEIQSELNEIKGLVKNLSVNNDMDKLNLEILKEYYDKLVENGVIPKIAFDILKKIELEIDLKSKDKSTMRNIIEYHLIEVLGDSKGISIEDEQKVIFFIGATGVGKTTTLAKIAANLVLDNTDEIGLVTSDTYRIAAVEQLKIYSNILQLPLEIVYNKNDTLGAIEKFKDKKIILIDTAGRNHNDLKQIKQLNEVLEIDVKKEIFLVISANTDYDVLKNLIEKYSYLDEFKLIVTKIDEVENHGVLLNIKYLTDREISYYTTGQNVPDDIKKLDPKEILDEIIGENLYEWSSRKTKKINVKYY